MRADIARQISCIILDPSDEYMLGMEMPYTFSPPTASAAMAATSAESMPPDRPRHTPLKWFLAM